MVYHIKKIILDSIFKIWRFENKISVTSQGLGRSRNDIVKIKNMIKNIVATNQLGLAVHFCRSRERLFTK